MTSKKKKSDKNQRPISAPPSTVRTSSKQQKKPATSTTADNNAAAGDALPSCCEEGGGEFTQTLPPFLGYIRHTPTKPRLPAYSLAARVPAVGLPTHISPGPARYAIRQNLTCTGKLYDGGITMAMGRLHDGPNRSRLITQAMQEQAANGGEADVNTPAQLAAAKFALAHSTPGPAAYRPEQYEHPRYRRAPIWSTAGRLATPNAYEKFPSPATYTIPVALGPRVPNMPSSPAAGLGERTKYGGVEIADRMNTGHGPGPARYALPDPNCGIWTSGGVSIKSRPKDAASNVESSKKTFWFGTLNVSKPKQPQFSFGIKHSRRKREL